MRPLTNKVDLQQAASDRVTLASTETAGGTALDLSTSSVSTQIKVTTRNVRYHNETGIYSAVLQLQNDGALVGKQVAIAFPGLPADVTLRGASGTTSGGTPYLNVSGSIGEGGLPTGERSGGILVQFDNPKQLLFTLNPQVLVKSNRAPVLPAIATQVLTPGAYVQLNLQATDPDGDAITYHLENSTGLPNGQFSSAGQLTLRPTPADLGNFGFDIVASDGSLSCSPKSHHSNSRRLQEDNAHLGLGPTDRWHGTGKRAGADRRRARLHSSRWLVSVGLGGQEL